VDRARITLTSGADRCLGVDTTFGIGFMTPGAFSSLLGPGSLGHPGAGGSGAALPEMELAFGYVMNQMQMNLAGDDRVIALTDALLTCVSDTPQHSPPRRYDQRATDPIGPTRSRRADIEIGTIVMFTIGDDAAETKHRARRGRQGCQGR
jgi:hypothetical protein